jgi:GLPGLI family protein
MKKSVLILMFGVISQMSFAQDFEGLVKYSRVFDPSKAFANNPNANRMGGNMMEQARKPMIFLTAVKGQEWVYKADPKQDPGENVMEFNGERRTFPRRLPKDETYYNAAEGQFKRYEEYAQQPFQVSGELNKVRWKVDPTQTRPILGYECMMATATETEKRTMPVWNEAGTMTMKDTVVVNEITAWFTDAISSSVGPDKYFGLPGLILALDINNGVTTYVATAVEPKVLSADDLKINSKGKKMTPEQLDKLKREHQAEQMKNFRGRGGQAGGVMIMRSGE